MSVSLVALRCSTSDRTPYAGLGVDTLAPLVGRQMGTEPRSIGEPGRIEPARWDEVLRDARGCILEAGGQVEDALTGGNIPVLLAAECTIALTTLPAVLRQRPDSYVLWLDAHGDFNTPDTSPSGYLGGMCLAGACGAWDPGIANGRVPPGRLVLAGVRDLDPPEREALERSDATVIGASPVETLVAVKNAIGGAPAFVHLDLDVLDPEHFPAQFPSPGGLHPDKLYDLLESVTEESEIVGLEITAFEAPEDEAEREAAAATALHAMEPLLDRIASARGLG